MIHHITCDSPKGRHRHLSSRWNNSSLFMRLAKQTKRLVRARTSNPIIVLPDLYDSNNHITIENLIIKSLIGRK